MDTSPVVKIMVKYGNCDGEGHVMKMMINKVMEK